MDLDARGHEFMVVVVAEDVILDLVVAFEPQFAVGALAGSVGHAFIVGQSGSIGPESSVLIVSLRRPTRHGTTTTGQVA